MIASKQIKYAGEAPPPQFWGAGLSDGISLFWLPRIGAGGLSFLLLLLFAASLASADPAPLFHATPGTDGAGALTFDPGAPAQKWQIVPGREAGTKAVHLDQGALVGPAFPIKQAFTVTLWCRPQGMGVMRGNSGTTNGMLLAVGDGYWSGWRLTVTYPDAHVGFEIGRPQPSSSVQIAGGTLVSDAWQHIAASWDGKQMRLYLNGLPIAQGPYDGVYTPASQLRIGFANAGVGSLNLDVSEITAYDHALDPLAVLEAANAPTLLPDTDRAAFRQALEYRSLGDFASAAAAFRAAGRQAGLPPIYQAAARLGLAEALQGLGNPTQAAAEYAALVDATDIPDNSRQEAGAALRNLLLRGAAGDLSLSTLDALYHLPGATPAQRMAVLFASVQQLRATGDYAAAKVQCGRLLAMPDLTLHDRWNAELEQVHVLRQSGDWEAAHSAALHLAWQPNVPGEYGSVALLALARSAANTGQYALARTAYREAAALPNAPPHHVEEARLGLREVARMQAGKPAEDPDWSHTRLPPEPKPAAVFYVAVTGSDANPGTQAQPFATLARARDAVHALRHAGALPRGGVRVIVRGGEYPLTESFALTADDSGTADAPIIYAAAPGETPILTGAVRLNSWSPASDPEALARLPAEARSHVLQTDLRAAGVTDFGQMQPHGYGQKPVPIPELFFNGKPMTLARWPNTGFVLTGKILDAGMEGQAGRGMEFEYEGGQPAHWSDPADAWLYGYWYWDWADLAVPVASIDPATHRIRTTTTPQYGIRSGQRFYAYNILEELDAPGEWYLDRKRGLLFFYPPEDMQAADVRFSVLSAPLVTLTDVSHVTLRGLTLEGGRAAGVTITGGDHCLLAGCTVRRLGGDAVIIDGGADHGVLGCDLYTLGRGGVRMTGGDRKTLTPGGHFVENCDIHDFSRLDRTYTPAVQIEGVGNRIAHNHLHDAPHHAIRVEGNDHIVEFNEVDHVVTEADDQGGLDIWRDPTYRGNVFRDNFWHDIGSGMNAVGQAGIRLDDAISGTLIYGNVFQRCAGGNFGGIQINGGKDNVMDNNLFINCKTAISIGSWGLEGWKKFLADPAIVELTTKTVDIHSPPYSVRYPALAALEDYSTGNAVWRNAVINCPQFLTGDSSQQHLTDNYLAAHDPGSRLPEMTGFAPIPLAEMGLYQSADRASQPVRAARSH